jgi:hypothetical protein
MHSASGRESIAKFTESELRDKVSKVLEIIVDIEGDMIKTV